MDTTPKLQKHHRHHHSTKDGSKSEPKKPHTSSGVRPVRQYIRKIDRTLTISPIEIKDGVKTLRVLTREEFAKCAKERQTIDTNFDQTVRQRMLKDEKYKKLEEKYPKWFKLPQSVKTVYSRRYSSGDYALLTEADRSFLRSRKKLRDRTKIALIDDTLAKRGFRDVMKLAYKTCSGSEHKFMDMTMMLPMSSDVIREYFQMRQDQASRKSMSAAKPSEPTTTTPKVKCAAPDVTPVRKVKKSVVEKSSLSNPVATSGIDEPMDQTPSSRTDDKADDQQTALQMEEVDSSNFGATYFVDEVEITGTIQGEADKAMEVDQIVGSSDVDGQVKDLTTDAMDQGSDLQPPQAAATPEMHEQDDMPVKDVEGSTEPKDQAPDSQPARLTFDEIMGHVGDENTPPEFHHDWNALRDARAKRATISRLFLEPTITGRSAKRIRRSEEEALEESEKKKTRLGAIGITPPVGAQLVQSPGALVTTIAGVQPALQPSVVAPEVPSPAATLTQPAMEASSEIVRPKATLPVVLPTVNSPTLATTPQSVMEAHHQPRSFEQEHEASTTRPPTTIKPEPEEASPALQVVRQVAPTIRRATSTDSGRSEVALVGTTGPAKHIKQELFEEAQDLSPSSEPPRSTVGTAQEAPPRPIIHPTTIKSEPAVHKEARARVILPTTIKQEPIDEGYPENTPQAPAAPVQPAIICLTEPINHIHSEVAVPAQPVVEAPVKLAKHIKQELFEEGQRSMEGRSNHVIVDASDAQDAPQATMNAPAPPPVPAVQPVMEAPAAPAPIIRPTTIKPEPIDEGYPEVAAPPTVVPQVMEASPVRLIADAPDAPQAGMVVPAAPARIRRPTTIKPEPVDDGYPEVAAPPTPVQPTMDAAPTPARAADYPPAVVPPAMETPAAPAPTIRRMTIKSEPIDHGYPETNGQVQEVAPPQPATDVQDLVPPTMEAAPSPPSVTIRPTTIKPEPIDNGYPGVAASLTLVQPTMEAPPARSDVQDLIPPAMVASPAAPATIRRPTTIKPEPVDNGYPEVAAPPTLVQPTMDAAPSRARVTDYPVVAPLAQPVVQPATNAPSGTTHPRPTLKREPVSDGYPEVPTPVTKIAPPPQPSTFCPAKHIKQELFEDAERASEDHSNPHLAPPTQPIVILQEDDADIIFIPPPAPPALPNLEPVYEPATVPLVLPDNQTCDWLQWTEDDCQNWVMKVAKDDAERRYFATSKFKRSTLLHLADELANRDADWDFYTIGVHFKRVMDAPRGME